MYLHKKEYEIRYTDVDFKDNLKLSALTSLMEESACLSADELNFGYAVVQPKNLGFVLVNWYIELFRPVKLGESLTVCTWPIKPKKLLVFRDYELFVGEEKVGVATSRWCLIDVNTFLTLPTDAVFANDYREYNDFRSVETVTWKIPAISDGELVYSRGVVYSDYDHYNHVNNTKYADFLLDAFSVDEFAGKTLKTAQITYVKQCKFGERLDFYRQKCDGFYLVEARVGDEVRASMKVTFSED